LIDLIPGVCFIARNEEERRSLTRPIQEKKVTSEALRKGAGPLAAQLIAFEPGKMKELINLSMSAGNTAI
jgi:hypothetical protein